MSPSGSAAKPRTRAARGTLRFQDKLVLNQWLLSLFTVPSFDKLVDRMKGPEAEGFDENGVSRFHHLLSARLATGSSLSGEMLLAYDENIVRHWKRITEKRNIGLPTVMPSANDGLCYNGGDGNT